MLTCWLTISDKEVASTFKTGTSSYSYKVCYIDPSRDHDRDCAELAWIKHLVQNLIMIHKSQELNNNKMSHLHHSFLSKMPKRSFLSDKVKCFMRRLWHKCTLLHISSNHVWSKSIKAREHFNCLLVRAWGKIFTPKCLFNGYMWGLTEKELLNTIILNSRLVLQSRFR